MADSPIIDPETQRRLAASLFNQTWDLMGLKIRSPEQADAMVAMAYASLHHWSRVGSARELAIGHWQVARACGLAGLLDSSSHHAHRCLAIVESAGLGAFDRAFACEGLARAEALRGAPQAAREWTAKSRAALEGITDAEEREVIQNDLRSVEALLGATP